MLYLFAMIIFILIRRRHQRDKRLREQFLNMPLPPGLGYKSSRILGLEGDQSNLNTRFGSGFNPYFPNAGGKLRQSTRSSNGGGIVGNGSGQADGNGMHCSLHTGDGNDHHDHIYDITKVGCIYFDGAIKFKSNSTSKYFHINMISLFIRIKYTKVKYVFLWWKPDIIINLFTSQIIHSSHIFSVASLPHISISVYKFILTK